MSGQEKYGRSLFALLSPELPLHSILTLSKRLVTRIPISSMTPQNSKVGPQGLPFDSILPLTGGIGLERRNTKAIPKRLLGTGVLQY
ncbi:hypothetical protein ASC90_12885 [Rhizobium sp. Root1220]|nr:hypothetical protein ASC90_12885 [Rhizobium sp. Root1220]